MNYEQLSKGELRQIIEELESNEKELKVWKSLLKKANERYAKYCIRQIKELKQMIKWLNEDLTIILKS